MPEQPCVWLNGVLVPRDRATVSIDDLGFMYGAACFETMRAFNGVVFRLHQHLARLDAGLEVLGVHRPDFEMLADAIAAALGANSLTEARVRLTISAGRGNGRPDLTAPTEPTILITTEPPLPDPAPARLAVASLHINAERALPGAKTANYLTSLLAIAEAREHNADDALLLSPRGDAVEAATANIFAVTAAGELVTPPLVTGPLPGVTREAVMECARDLGLTVRERRLMPAVLADAAEVFTTNSVVGLRPVSHISGWWTGGDAPGPLTVRLMQAYAELVARECASNRE